MTVHNPTSQSRLCYGLGRHIEPYEVAETRDGFEKCAGCRCQVSEETPAPKPEGEPEILK